MAITSPALTVNAGGCSGPFTFESRNSLGQATPVTSTTTVSVSSSNSQVSFFTSASCTGAPTSSVGFTPTASTATLYLRSNLAGTSTLTVSAALTLGSANQTLRVLPGPPTLTFTAPGGSMPAFGCVALQVQLLDAYANAVPLSAASMLTLTAPMGAVRFHSDSLCAGTAVTSLLMAAGTSTLSFGVRAVSGGDHLITATVTGLTASTMLQVDPAVRRGTCLIPSGTLSTTCAISPPQRDLSKTLLVSQAIAPGAAEPGAAQVACRLQSTGQVSCARRLAGPVGSGSVAITWQTLELPSGLSVVRGSDVGCPTVLPLASPVDPDTSWTFSTITTMGTNFGEDDTTTGRLSSDGMQMLFDVSGATPCSGYDYQVATMAGVSVLRGVAPGFTAFGSTTRAQSVTGLPAASTNSVLISQANLINAVPLPPMSASMCHFFTRGELDSSSSLRFTRGSTANTGCDSYAMGSLVWQRVDFGTRASVQAFNTVYSANTGQLARDISTIDPTRTLVFSGGMMASGQATGETTVDVAGVDEIGSAVALFELTSAARVTLTRGASGNASTFTWYVVQFEP